MSTDVSGYRQALVAALRMRDVPGNRIADALAQVDSHLEESGEAPEEAFGPPAEYAATLAGALDPARPTRWRAVVAALTDWTVPVAVVAGFLLGEAMFSLGAGTETLLGLGAPLTLVIALVLAAAVAARVRTRREDRLVDPRTGEEVTFGGRWGAVAAYGMPVAALGLLYVFGRTVG